MRKLLVTIIASLVFAGCTQTDTTDPFDAGTGCGCAPLVFEVPCQPEKPGYPDYYMTLTSDMLGAPITPENIHGIEAWVGVDSPSQQGLVLWRRFDVFTDDGGAKAQCPNGSLSASMRAKFVLP